IQILPHRHPQEEFPRFRALDNTAARNGAYGSSFQITPVVVDRAFIRNHSGNGVEECRLAGAIQTDHGDELFLAETQRNTLESLSLAVKNVDIPHIKKRCRLLFGLLAFSEGRLDLAAEIDLTYFLALNDLLGR